MFHVRMDLAVPLLEVTRGGIMESAHRGAVAVADCERLQFTLGDPSWPVYYRSTSKPIQAIVGITSGAADSFGLTPQEIALAAGSHSTRPEHVEAARSILDKAGVPEAALGCGGHYAFDPEFGPKQQAETDTPLRVWSNCSGNHALMLATAKHLGLPLDTYLHPEHPVQATIRGHVALLCGLEGPDAVVVGIDGCSAPAFAVPLGAMALSLARFGAPEGLPSEVAEATRRIAMAMLEHPNMVGGPGRFDTDLMVSSAEPLIPKAGAEGVHGVCAPARGLGLAVKAEDGRDRGYRLVVLTVLERLGLLAPDEAEGLRTRQCNPRIASRRDEDAGRLEVLFDGPTRIA